MSTEDTPVGHRMDATSQEVYDAGMAVRREVLGDAHVDRAEACLLYTSPSPRD